MRILFQYFTGGGGALSNLILLLKALSKQFPQDHIDIVCSHNSDLKTLGSIPNIDIVVFGGSRHQEIDRAFLGFWGLKRIAGERKADIIWSLNIGSYARSSIPQVLSVNNAYQIYPWDVTCYHPDNRLNVAALRWFFRRSLKVSDGVIVQTAIMEDYVRKTIGAPKFIQVVPKAVENSDDVDHCPLPSLQQKMFECGLGKDVFTCLYVATNTPHKNHKTIIDALDILAIERVNVRVVLTLSQDELLVIGGEKALRLIQKGHLVPIGWTQKNYLKSLYGACDACLMPSVLESLSSAHLEAMQWGNPQITSDLPYARELCGDAAVYVSAEDALGWAQNIRRLIADPKLRQQLVRSGYKRMKLFPATWSETANKVHSFFGEIIDQSKYC